MNNQKIEQLLTVSMNVTDSERRSSPDLEVGVSPSGELWEIIVKYSSLSGDFYSDITTSFPNIQVYELLGQYAVLITPKSYINEIANKKYIEFIEKPKLIQFEIQEEKSASCISALQQGFDNPNKLYGTGTIVAVIDTGIDAANSEFLDAQGKTRIISAWDQDKDEYYTSDDINRMIEQGTANMDFVGHGTQVAAIACGNSGVAPNASIIVVKMGNNTKLNDSQAIHSFPRTTQLMRAIDYCIRQAGALNMPIAINISFGNNYGSHRGDSILETYINSVCDMWKCCICIGSGNEGLGIIHHAGILQNGKEELVELAVGNYETSVGIQIWKDYWEDFQVEIIAPTGQNLGRISGFSRINRMQINNNLVLSYYGEPSPYSMKQEIYINILSENGYITTGIWKLRLIPFRLINGYYNIWLTNENVVNSGTGFIIPDSYATFTIPSTVSNAITVGAYDSYRYSYAPFSGRGWEGMQGSTSFFKPDIVAPGVEVNLGAGTYATGTSFATPFATGAAALLMEWGIVKGNDDYLWGQKVKAYLINSAKQLPGFGNGHNPLTGWGTLCVKI